jgi:hypothetical protein
VWSYILKMKFYFDGSLILCEKCVTLLQRKVLEILPGEFVCDNCNILELTNNTQQAGSL